MQKADTPHTHTLLTQRFDKVAPQAAAAPHLHVPASHVSVVRVHAGSQFAEKEQSEISKIVLLLAAAGI